MGITRRPCRGCLKTWERQSSSCRQVSTDPSAPRHRSRSPARRPRSRERDYGDSPRDSCQRERSKSPETLIWEANFTSLMYSLNRDGDRVFPVPEAQQSTTKPPNDLAMREEILQSHPTEIPVE